LAENLRLLKYGRKGDDVKAYQENLIKLGFTTAFVNKKTKKMIADGDFGVITKQATKDFQTYAKKKLNSKMIIDGIVGSQTRDAINKALNTLLKPVAPIVINYLPATDYPQVDATILTSINAELQNVSEIRRKVVQEVLHMVYPFGLYIRGGNSYTTKLEPYYATVEIIESGAKRQPEYYDGGRKEFMIGHVNELSAKGKKCFAADCSGMVVGIWRKFGLVSPTFDATANNILANSCYSISQSDLKPADCVGCSGHIGLYLGAGYTVEDAGGAYGIQISGLTTRKVINQLTGKSKTKSKWTKMGRPKTY
jgi:peptidoglycan hydrolase-like protein with peptidoglycan-binding domain